MDISYIAFINVKVAKRLGIEVDDIHKPNDIWNVRNVGSRDELGYVFGSISNEEDKERIESMPKYIELEKDPDYVKKILAGSS